MKKPVLAMVLSLLAAEVQAAPAPDDIRLNELTAQYTVLYQTGANVQAVSIAEQALAEAEAVFGPDHERVAQALNDLGRLHELCGEMEQAVRAHERALTIRDKVFSSDGPAVAQSLDNLARIYVAQGRHAKARPLYERSLAITERYVPPGNPALLRVLEPYAALLRNDGAIDEAVRLEARIQAIHAAQEKAKTK